MTVKIGVVGCDGRMGRMIVKAATAADGAEIAAGCDRPDSADLGRDVGELAGIGPIGVPLGDAAAAVFAAADVVIDFTVPGALAEHARLARDTGTALLVGTTGLQAAETAALDAAAERAAVLWAPNMSLGVNLLLTLVERAAAALGPDYDIEVLEMHHRHKADAPSGTALALGRAAAAGRGVDLSGTAVYAREGQTGPRRPGAIGFATLRGGDVAGDHAVIFAGPGERLELGHRASSREVFAQGAIKAALWLHDRPPGLYAMADVLGLSS
jgi:4-hydroxy-tetrahydrodipicolinate reductase